MNTTGQTVSQSQGVGTPSSPASSTTSLLKSGVSGGEAKGGGAVGLMGGKIATEDLLLIKTPSGKTIKDFVIPDRLKNNDPELVDYIMRSESMKDQERQYWFNLSEIMTPAQIEKLRDILKRERQKLAEIDAKYGKTTIDPIQAAKRAKALAAKRAAQQARLRQKEAEIQAREAEEEEAILKELEQL